MTKQVQDGAAARATTDAAPPVVADADLASPPLADPNEIGGPRGPEPTRYGDWERKGRCVDF